MKDYTIYCTEEQTKKALDLGAPIKQEYIGKCITEGLPRVGCNTEEDVKDYLCPTAEQMIGWLEEQDAVCGIVINYFHGVTLNHWAFWAKMKDQVFMNEECNSRKEATLAAIDAALDYLHNIKEE